MKKILLLSISVYSAYFLWVSRYTENLIYQAWGIHEVYLLVPCDPNDLYVNDRMYIMHNRLKKLYYPLVWFDEKVFGKNAVLGLPTKLYVPTEKKELEKQDLETEEKNIKKDLVEESGMKALLHEARQRAREEPNALRAKKGERATRCMR